MIKVNKEVIKAMDPCKSRFDENYLVHYSEFDGSIDEFLDLDKITYGDKIWVARRILNKNQLVHFAVLCAQSVLSIYENKYPEDKRISDLINFMVTIVDFSDLSDKQQSKLRDLRNDACAAAGAAYAAAGAAAYAAADAAYAAADAAYAANAAADAAANDAYDAAADARKNQQDLNLQFLKMAASL